MSVWAWSKGGYEVLGGGGGSCVVEMLHIK